MIASLLGLSNPRWTFSILDDYLIGFEAIRDCLNRILTLDFLFGAE
jgi:hypothetical protein